MSSGDMFLKLDGARQGAIKGEAQDDLHKDEIDVIGWSWGMHAQTGMSAGGDSGKSTIDEIGIVKRVDSASTALMACVRNNEPIKKGVLTVRKAGGDALEYVKITIEKGRITSIDVRSDGAPPNAELTEELKLAFQKISVEYTPQGTDGLPGGAMIFETDIE
jgi:type VI secretion system secreted protein Hcp